MRTVITCDLCRNDLPDDARVAMLTVPETYEHDRVAREVEDFLRSLWGRLAPTRNLHICQGCVRGLLQAASLHRAAVRP